MIRANSRNAKELFGLFELDDQGNILYSRPRLNGQFANGSEEIIGQNFFHEVATFENRDDLRRHFRRFAAGTSAADSFIFDCLYGDEKITVRISLTRGRESDFEHSSGIVIMDINHAGINARHFENRGK